MCDPVDVLIQSDAHAGAVAVPHGIDSFESAVAGLVDFVRAGDGEPEFAVVRGAGFGAGRGGRPGRVGDGAWLPAGGESGHGVRQWGEGAGEDDPEPEKEGGGWKAAAGAPGRGAAAESELQCEFRPLPRFRFLPLLLRIQPL